MHRRAVGFMRDLELSHSWALQAGCCVPVAAPWGRGQVLLLEPVWGEVKELGVLGSDESGAFEDEVIPAVGSSRITCLWLFLSPRRHFLIHVDAGGFQIPVQFICF